MSSDAFSSHRADLEQKVSQLKLRSGRPTNYLEFEPMIVFQVENKEYRGTSALEIVRALQSDTEDYPHTRHSVRHFLFWSLNRLGDRVHPREMDLSDRLDDETLALSYLHLRDEYEAGKLLRDGEI